MTPNAAALDLGTLPRVLLDVVRSLGVGFRFFADAPATKVPSQETDLARTTRSGPTLGTYGHLNFLVDAASVVPHSSCGSECGTAVFKTYIYLGFYGVAIHWLWVQVPLPELVIQMFTQVRVLLAYSDSFIISKHDVKALKVWPPGRFRGGWTALFGIRPSHVVDSPAPRNSLETSSATNSQGRRSGEYCKLTPSSA